MSQRHLHTLLVVLSAACTAPAMAQNAYKCGNSYSQSPCPGGVAIDTSDSRSPAQKAQTDAATARDARAAHTMEQKRLKQEAAALAASRADEKQALPPKPKNKPHAQKKKGKEPEYFTAREPGGKKPAPKNSKPVNDSALPAGAGPSTRP